MLLSANVAQREYIAAFIHNFLFNLRVSGYGYLKIPLHVNNMPLSEVACPRTQPPEGSPLSNDVAL